MRNIGINVRPDISYGVDPFLNSIAHVGFNSVFTCGNDEDFIKHTAEKCNELNMCYEALHAPWTNINDMWYDNELSRTVLNNFCRSAELADEYGIPMLIVHVSSKEDCPHITDIGLKHFDEFVNFAAKRNLTVAVENQRKLGNIATILEVYGNDTNVAFCWDVGHEKCFAHGREYMPLFADRCVMTHIHDNNCMYNVDEHLLPFDGQIDFRRTAELISKYGYKGTLMLEIDLPHEGSDKYLNLTLEQFTAKAYAAINRLRVISEY